MKNGYKILWTPNSLKELDETIEYLQDNFSEKEITKLAKKTESIIELISQNPDIFPKSEFKDARKVAILKFNTMYYRINGDVVEILSFFSNRKNPDKRKI